MSTTTDESAETLPPDSLIDGRFRVVRRLGIGGMGAVYEARNTLNRRFAIKVMRPEVARNAAYAKRFLQEAQAASQLAHPNIVDVIELGEDKALGVLYIVQEFLTGNDLRAHMTSAGRLPASQALALILPVMEALVMAHARGIVHRDLKPDNIFLAETARGIVPKVIDFGIAKVVGEDGGSLQRTNTGMMMGTPYYMAPEQVSGESDLDGRADVWAMGVLLYEMLSGTRPYNGPTANVIIAKILYEDPRPLADAAPDLPADVVAAVMGALRRDRTQRHPSMQAFLDALRGCAVTRDGGGVAAPGALPQTSAPAPVPTMELSPPLERTLATGGGTLVPRVETLPPDAVVAQAARRRGMWKVAVVGALVLGFAALGASSLRHPTVVARPAAAAVAARPAPVALPVTPVVVQALPAAAVAAQPIPSAPAPTERVAPSIEERPAAGRQRAERLRSPRPSRTNAPGTAAQASPVTAPTVERGSNNSVIVR